VSTAQAPAGILIVDKPAGPTSHDVVAVARRVLACRKVGHLGTLDPLATGVLPLVVGRATRLASLLSGAAKQYDAVIRLGLTTDTDDIAGAVVGRLVEIGVAVLHPDEHRPFRVPMFLRRHRPGGCEHDLQLRQEDFERFPVGAGVHEVAGLPAQPVPQDASRHGPLRPGDPGRGMLFCDAGDSGGLVLRVRDSKQCPKLPLATGDVAVGDDLGLDHDGRRDHEAHGLNETQPFLVGEDEVAALAIHPDLPRPRPEVDEAERIARTARTR